MIEPKMPSSGLVVSVAPGSVGARVGVRVGDRLIAVNGHAVEDVIDVQFYAAEEEVELEWLREGVQMRARASRASGQALGLEFEQATFDVDIRRCNNLCPFCFVLQTGPGMRRTLYIKDDDYRYSFLFGHYVTLTNLRRRDWERIAEQHLSPLYVSVHATQPEVRQACLSSPAAGEILAQLRDLAAHGIEVHTQIVLTPGLNDGERLARSLRDLSELFPSVRSCTVVPVGLTRHHRHGLRPYTPEEARVIVGEVEEMQSVFLRRLGSRFAFLTDEWYLALRRPVPQAGDYEDLDLRENGLGMARDFLTEWEVTRIEAARLRRRLEDGGAGRREQLAVRLGRPDFPTDGRR
jgi:putative radical SAM enzyme (TIGR03279 family)